MTDNDDAQARQAYMAALPAGITTPDVVETRLGTLEYWDGVPTRRTAELLYDNLDFLRGVETFLNGIPAASLEAIRRGMEGLGITASNQVLLFDELMDSTPLFLTGNSSTVYASTFLDLKRDGPTVIEVPAGTAGPLAVEAELLFRRYRQEFLDKVVPEMERDSGVLQPTVVQTTAAGEIPVTAPEGSK